LIFPPIYIIVTIIVTASDKEGKKAEISGEETENNRADPGNEGGGLGWPIRLFSVGIYEFISSTEASNG
jgi:hypothetical protein